MVPGEFRPKLFLLRALIGVFIYQGLAVILAMVLCGQQAKLKGSGTLSETCPDLANRMENLFGVATATILSLLSSDKLK